MPTAKIDLLILDVDGVLTDGRITPGADGGTLKSFYVQDGCAIKLWQKSGKQIAILSGRDEPSVKLRAAELGILTIVTGVSNKGQAYQNLLKGSGHNDAQVAYVGDDYPDLPPMRRSGFPVAVANAVAAVKRSADYVTRKRGGQGAVAEVIELLLRRQGQWSREMLAKS